MARAVPYVGTVEFYITAPNTSDKPLASGAYLEIPRAGKLFTDEIAGGAEDPFQADFDIHQNPINPAVYEVTGSNREAGVDAFAYRIDTANRLLNLSLSIHGKEYASVKLPWWGYVGFPDGSPPINITEAQMQQAIAAKQTVVTPPASASLPPSPPVPPSSPVPPAPVSPQPGPIVSGINPL